jgi:16S rRNA (cytosine967-C5)-methyltransferase
MARAFAAAASRLRPVLGGASLAGASAVGDGGEPAALRAQVHELLYGTLRRYGEGDAIIARLVDRKLDVEVRALLLLGLYRLVTSPDDTHTTVNQAVDAAPLAGCGRAGGLINAVLRGFLRRRDEFLAAIAGDETVRHAHPDWWLRRLRAAWPDDWAGIVEADNRQPPITLRINARRQDVVSAVADLRAAGVGAVAADGAAEWWPAAVRIESPGRIDRLPGFAEGRFSVQDPAAQRAAILLDAKPGQRVLDACAAPGGKAGHLLEIADVELTALEYDPARATLITENLDRLGLRERARVVVGDAGHPDPWWDGEAYDRILADVPCTASGVVRRHPDAKWIRREADIASFAKQQRRILDALWPLLKPGGRLLYATCSLFPEENDRQVDAFLERHPDAISGSRERWRPDAAHDGFFYAVLDKR